MTRLATPIVIVLLAMVGVAGCGDDPTDADWDQLTFPSDAMIFGPVAVENGIYPGNARFAVVRSMSGNSPFGMALAIRDVLIDQGWDLHGKPEARADFVAGAPDSDDVVAVESIQRLQDYPKAVRDLIESTPQAKEGVIVRLLTTEQQPE